METDTQHDDQLLVRDARQGNSTAFETLVQRHQLRAYRVALGVLRNPDDAQEICQEAFIRVHRYLDSFDSRAQFTTWLHRIVVNLSIDHLRRRRTSGVTVELSQVSGAELQLENVPIEIDPLRRLLNHELGGHLQSALAQLSPAHRQVLILREVEELSYKELAEVLRISIGTVMSRLFHARRRMQVILSASAEAPPLQLAA